MERSKLMSLKSNINYLGSFLFLKLSSLHFHGYYILSWTWLSISTLFSKTPFFSSFSNNPFLPPFDFSSCMMAREFKFNLFSLFQECKGDIFLDFRKWWLKLRNLFLPLLLTPFSFEIQILKWVRVQGYIR
jgi:hypothetical protein